MQDGVTVNNRNTITRHPGRVFASPSILMQASEKHHLAQARESAKLCRSNLEAMIGEVLEDTDTAVGYIDQMYVSYRGVDTNLEQWKRIHFSFKRLAARFGHKLTQVGRSATSIAPMIAVPLQRQKVDLNVTGSNDKLPVMRTPEGWSVNFDSQVLKGWLEIGSIDGQFGVIRAFDGMRFTTASHRSMIDKVRLCVMASVSATARCFDDAVEHGDGDRAAEMIAEVYDMAHVDDRAFWRAVKDCQHRFGKIVNDLVAEVEQGSVAAATRIAAAGGEVVEVVPADPAKVAECELAEAALALEREQLQAELAKVEAEATAAPVEPKTWYNAITGEETLSTACPGEGWVTHKVEIVQGGTIETTRVKTLRAATEAVALDDAVASAVANDPEAAAVMQKIEEETKRRAEAATTLSAVELSAATVVSEHQSAGIDAGVEAAMTEVVATQKLEEIVQEGVQPS